jgi:DNA-binding NtrC family response regulator
VLSSRILIIDDSAEMRNLLGRVLARDYQTTSVSSGAEAIELAKSEGFKVVFLASRVLKKEGLPVLDSLKSIQSGAQIIAVADHPGDPFLNQVKDRGLYAGVYKPFNISEILELVRRVLGERG